MKHLFTVTVVVNKHVNTCSLCRDGCRPYVEIYNNERIELNSLQDYDRLHLFTAAEGKVSLEYKYICYSHRGHW